jgi:signal transduction histidine kinase
MTELGEQEYRILLIDDEPRNLGVLSVILERRGVELLTARSGERGLEIAQLNHPDLILLDVMMPGIDGFETCRRLKGDEGTADIPVIFTTILDDLENKLVGFQAGAVDYLSKPFQEEEVVARVGKHIEIHRLQRVLQQRNQELEQKNEELESFSHTVAHNLKTPIGQVKSICDTLSEVGIGSREFLGLAKSFIPLLSQASDKMLGSVDALLLLAKIEKGQLPEYLKECDVRACAVDALDTLGPTVESQGARIEFEGGTWPKARAHAPWIVEIWKNYIGNGLKYGGDPPHLVLGADVQGPYAEYRIKDNGEGIDETLCDKLFIPFSRLHRNTREGHGLGLSIVDRIMEMHGGDVGVDGNPGAGSRFYFRLLVDGTGLEGRT